MKPAIGISTNFRLDAVGTDPPREMMYLLAAYADAVLKVGGMPLLLPVLHEHGDAEVDELLASVDGLLLTGGFDLHPQHYGEQTHPRTVTLHPRRDAFEVDLFRRADAGRVPTFAICLGMQIAHVVRGGRLIQHVDDVARSPVVVHHLPMDRNAFHAVRIAGDSRLAAIVGANELEVSSRHHQIIDPQKPAAGLRPTAWAEDGVLEASEDFAGRFLLCVQWHPEDLTERPEHLALFAALVEAAGRS